MRKIGRYLCFFFYILAILIGINSVFTYADSDITIYYPDAEGNFGIKHTCSYDDGTTYQYIITANTKIPKEGTVITVTQSVPMIDTTSDICALKLKDGYDGGTGYSPNYEIYKSFESNGSFTLTSEYTTYGIGLWPRSEVNGFCDFLHWYPNGSIKSLYKELEIDSDGKVIKGTKEIRDGGTSGNNKDDEFHVIYSSNTTDSFNGILPNDPAAYKADDTVTVSASSISREGYLFVGWNTKADGSGITYKAGDTFAIKGNTTLFAIWEPKGFVLKKHNNSWYHSNSAGKGFEGKTDYSFNSAAYFNQLLKNEHPFMVSRVINQLHNKWGGSCYGIASTMGLLYLKKSDIKQYSDASASCYYELPRPAADTKFMDVINYYQLSQFVGSPYKAYSFSDLNIGKSTEEYLEDLYNETKDNNAVIFCYGIPNSGSGHAILALDSEDKENGSHRIKLYDMNSYDNNGGKYIYMDISSDFKNFSFSDGNGKNINQDNYTWLETEDWNKMKLLKNETASIASLSSVNSNGHASITLAENSTITNADRKWLKYEDGKLSGDMTIYDVNPVSADENSLFLIEVDDSERFTIEGNVLSASVGSDNGYMSVEGSGFTKVILSYNAGIQMEGGDYSFKAFIQTDNDINENQKGLASFEGKGTGTVTVKKNGKDATAAGTLSDITAANYIGVEKYEETKEGGISEISVNTERKSIEETNEVTARTPKITVSDNKPMDYKEEIRGDFKIGYFSAVPFWGKSKPVVTTFGAISVSGNNTVYEVTKIKVNRKKGLIQITGLKDADKNTVKTIKKATKGPKGLPFTVNPYFVRDTDTVTPKTKNDGSPKSVKVKIFDKDYKAKKTEWKYDPNTKIITFTGNNLDGSYKLS